jgi:hypothetical protein
VRDSWEDEKREPVKEARKDDVDGKILGRWWKKRSVLNPRSAQVIRDHLAESIIAPSSTDEGER